PTRRSSDLHLPTCELSIAATQLDDPMLSETTGRRREPELQHGPIRPFGSKCGRKRCGGVDDQKIAGGEEARQLPKAAVHDAAVRAVRDEQTDVVAYLGRALGLEAGRELEGEGAHADTATGSRARYDPLGRSPSINARSPGTLSSGGGRSEMSSPGNASCCICVRMSPGSTAYDGAAGSAAPRPHAD